MFIFKNLGTAMYKLLYFLLQRQIWQVFFAKITL